MRTVRALLTVACLLALAGTAGANPVQAVPSEYTAAIQPQVALGDNGSIHLTFGQGGSVYYTKSQDGASFGQPVLVGTLEKLALGMRRGPRVTVTRELILITAISHADGNLHAWTSVDGSKWQENPALNGAASSAREGLHALAGDGRGRVAAVWLDLRTGKTSLWGKFSQDGGAHWGEDNLIYASPEGPICQCCAPSVAFAPDGRIGIMWRNLLQGARDLYVTETKDGKRFTPATKLGQGSWMLNACPMDGGTLAYDADNHRLPVWKRIRTVFTSEDSSREQAIAEAAAQPVAAFIGTKPLLFWESKGALMIRDGSAPPRVYAAEAKSASITSKDRLAVIAFEGTVKGRKTILCEVLR
jgi:hypothetical protein